MGMFVSPTGTIDLIGQKNARFGSGAPIREMAELQKEFRIFSKDHTLYSSFTVLNIKALNPQEQTAWRNFLDLVASYPSDRRDVNGHDRWRLAYEENLGAEPEKVLPMYVTVHSRDQERAVLVRTDKPTIFTPDDHIVISIPVAPRS